MRDRIRTKLRQMGKEDYDNESIDELEQEKPLFRLFFLKNDKDLSAEVVEVEDVGITEVKKRLGGGQSVFITRKSPKKLNLNQAEKGRKASAWHFSHI